MNKLKRILSMTLIVIMILSGSIPQANASTAAGAFQIKMIESFNSDMRVFDSVEAAELFLRSIFGDGIFTNVNGFDLEKPLFYQFGMMVYGKPKDASTGVPDNPAQPLSWGQTHDGRDYTNMLHPESVMKGEFEVVNEKDYPKHSLYTVKPFESQWNSPEYIGEQFLSEGTDTEQKELGAKLLELWSKNIINRLPEFTKEGRGLLNSYGTQPDPKENNGDLIHEMMNYDDIIESFQITSPPTPYSYGTAVAWFKLPGMNTLRHRTFFIDKIKPVDFIAKRMNYDDVTKQLEIRYEIEGYPTLNEDMETLKVRVKYLEEYRSQTPLRNLTYLKN